jgi:hypothetical protein
MLVAMAITLVMMAAVVTLFANITGSVRNRRATAEMSGQLRHVRNVLQQDLQGATCPGLTWQRPESNHGYIEIIEGQYRDYLPSMLTDGNLDSDQNGNADLDGDRSPDIDEIDPEQSIIPRANDGSLVQVDPNDSTKVVSAVNGLGDYDDILMLTVRNEQEPFVGRMPANVRQQNGQVYPFNVLDGTTQQSAGWDVETIESPLAEVVWFAIENPVESENPDNFFGEPGMRTIYRRTLLIAPWVNPYRYVNQNTNQVSETFQDGGDMFKAEPGLVRILNVASDDLAGAIAAVIAFQDRYDLSVRLEWDHNIGNGGRWKIMANTLGDLTKRENRFGHFGFFQGPGGSTPPRRIYPHAMVSWGSGYKGDRVRTVTDAEIPGSVTAADITANLDPNDSVVSYSVPQNLRGAYPVRPFVFLEEDCNAPATAQAMLNDLGEIVLVVHGPVPLWGARRGQDVMMTSALAFDLRVYDPGAPLFGMRDIPGDTTSPTSVVISPSDAGYRAAYLHADNTGANGIGTGITSFPFVGQGAYVDMGYGYDVRYMPPLMNAPRFASASAAVPWFFFPRGLSYVYGNQLAPGFAVFDTWSFHYENNGVNEDADTNQNTGQPIVDEGTNGIEDVGNYQQNGAIVQDMRLGVDDAGERETAPPYDKPLRGVQVLLRTYEPDSRAIRQVRVNQHFMPE